MKKFSFLLLLLITFSFLTAQTYELDKSFGENGVLKPNCDGDVCLGYKIQLLDNGDFLTYSMYQKYVESEEEDGEIRLEIRKFDYNGNLDTSFADKGIFSMKAYFAESPVDFCLLPDKSIVFQDLESYDSLKIYILNEKGKISKTLKFLPFENEIAIPYKCIYQNGYLYIAGNYSFEDKLFILKTDMNSNIDTTFAEKGIFTLSSNTKSYYFDDMEFQDSSIIIMATIDPINSDLFNRVIKLNIDGKPDSNFADQGYFDFEYIGFDADLQIDNKKRIVISSFQETSVIRHTPDGKPDISFGKSGIVNFEEENIPGFYFYSKILSDNTLLFFGSLTNDEDNPFGIPAILKLNEKGKRDNSFGTSGLQIHNVDSPGINLNGEIDANNNIMTIGAYQENPGDDEYFKMFLTRLKPKTSSEHKIIIGKDLSISPNPVNTNWINFKFPDNIKGNICIDIIDLLGQSVFKVDIPELAGENNEVTLDIPNSLKNGQYLAIVNDGKEIMSKKIVVSR